MIIFDRKLSTCFYFLVDRFFKLLQRWRSFLNQSHCHFCLAPTRSASDICADCMGDLPWNNTHCEQCALPIDSHKLLCGECLKSSPSFAITVCPLIYAFPIDQTIRSFKFGKRRYLKKLLGSLLLSRIREEYFEADLPDALIAVPMHKKKQRLRTFNQSELLAQFLSRELNIQIDKKVICKASESKSQSTLDRRSRQRNLSKTFLTKPHDYKHIALIDDVMTTGATAEIIAKQLLDNGAERIDIWCIARTPKKDIGTHTLKE